MHPFQRPPPEDGTAALVFQIDVGHLPLLDGHPDLVKLMTFPVQAQWAEAFVWLRRPASRDIDVARAANRAALRPCRPADLEAVGLGREFCWAFWLRLRGLEKIQANHATFRYDAQWTVKAWFKRVS